jgi:hypothetical protein
VAEAELRLKGPPFQMPLFVRDSGASAGYSSDTEVPPVQLEAAELG